MLKGIAFAVICIIVAVLIFCYYWRNSETKFKNRSFFVRNILTAIQSAVLSEAWSSYISLSKSIAPNFGISSVQGLTAN